MSALAGQRVVVLGGTRGIGLDVARQARALGASVLVGSRKPSEVSGLEARTVDVSDEASVSAFFAPESAVDHVYVAAGEFVGGTCLDGDLASFRHALEVRVWGTIHVVRRVAPKMRPHGTITLTGGLSTDRPVAGAFITAVGTAAAEQIARTLALELAPIRVNAIAPGWTDTPMWDPIFGENKAATFASVAAKIPLRRLATSKEAADAILFLMCNGAMSGEVVHVDGAHRLV